MGYYTDYNLTIHEDGKQYVDIEDAMNRIRSISKYSSLFNESCKWYDHESDMKKLSVEYPDTVFRLEGKGEDNEDIWVKYFKNGKMQGGKVTIVYPVYDAKLFK